MNLEKLLEIQGGLDAHIIKQHPEIEELENSDWKFLALQVELGELANEWRGFKVWSDDQEPRNEWSHTRPSVESPLLEEYVDGLHFILSLGNDLNINPKKPVFLSHGADEVETINLAFIWMFRKIDNLHLNCRSNNRVYLWWRLYWQYLYLGELLGFSEKEIEQAYYAKNLVNHKRQLNGY